MIDLDTYQPAEGDELSIETDMIEMPPALLGHHTPDETWTFVDTNGHEHRWDPSYSTLDQIAESDWIDVDGDEHNGDSWFVCRECGEVIEPATIYHPPSPWMTYLPGLKHAYLIHNGQRIEITLDQYERLAAQVV
jgi:hypothetical protein